MKDNLVIIHGGGPTAVLNCSLYGAIREAQQSGAVEHVYGAVGGTGGLLRENLLAHADQARALEEWTGYGTETADAAARA